MPGCVVEDLAELMMAEAVEARRQQDHQEKPDNGIKRDSG
jgi:hypothetical protein